MISASDNQCSEDVRRQILTATLTLLERQTLQSITVEAISKAAHVSKATIYRWWDSKSRIVMDAFAEHPIAKAAIRRDLPPRAAITQHMRDLARQYAGKGGRLVAELIAEGLLDPSFGSEFRARMLHARRTTLCQVLQEWRQSGEIDPNLRLDLLMDVLYGPIYMRLMVGHAPLDERFIADLQTFIFPLLGAPAPDGPALPAVRHEKPH